MVNFQEYYYLCKKNFNSKTKYCPRNIYDFTFDDNPPIKIPDILLDTVYKKTLIELKSSQCIKNNFSIGLGNNIFNLQKEIEHISKIILPYLENNIYGCYLNLTRAYIYKNIKTNQPVESSWMWHWDNHPNEMIKIIIYLTDTSADDGPFQILRNKDTGSGYRMPTNRLGPQQWGNHTVKKCYPECRISGQEIKKLLNKKKNLQPFKITGNRGKIIIFNNNIIHKANIPKKNERIILTLQVKPILIKRHQYFDKTFTGTFGSEFEKAYGPKDPFQTDNKLLIVKKKKSTNRVINYGNKFIVKFFKKKKNYDNEMKILKLLTEQHICPQVISFDDSKLVIVYNFCGKKMNIKMINSSIRTQFKNILSTLEKFQIKHNDLSKIINNHFQNILILNQNVFIIDFEFATINNKGPFKPKIYNDRDILNY